jgi:hypothetical protein
VGSETHSCFPIRFAIIDSKAFDKARKLASNLLVTQDQNGFVYAKTHPAPPMCPWPWDNFTGLYLIELLVVIAIIAILAACYSGAIKPRTRQLTLT